VDSTDSIVEGSNSGTDIVQIAQTYTLGANLENLRLTGTAAINGTGNTLNNVLDGSQNSAANVLTGGIGNDTYVVGTGDSIVENANEGTDTVQSSITWTLGANLENLTLTGTAAIDGTGNALNNTINGNSGTNVLDGGVGADTMAGGAGDDTYLVDNTSDAITEASGAGIDTVRSSVTFTLAASVENLLLTGTVAISGTGNGSDNVLDGSQNSGANVLTGGAGNDTYILGNGDTIGAEASNGGTDTVQTAQAYTLASNLENLTLTGTAAINGTGNSANNVLDGSQNTAANVLTGGAGNDNYILGNGDTIGAEASNGGTDTVQTAQTYSLPRIWKI
jgi:Ca2+-binding RTX toxin-like protein